MCRLIAIILFSIYVVKCSDVSKVFDDSILFDLEWSGTLNDQQLDENLESITVLSSRHEKYICQIPNTHSTNIDKIVNYNGSSVYELLKEMISENTCSYRFESYWNYEVCHGRYIKQYHETREGKKTEKQEYILGTWDTDTFEKLLEKNEHTTPPTTKIENVEYPYVEFYMGNGTRCDLSNKQPRGTRIKYVCYPNGRNEIESLREIATCQYEIIILSPVVCKHPYYKAKEVGGHLIKCFAADSNTGDKPYDLLKMKLDSYRNRREKHRIIHQVSNPEFIDVKNHESTSLSSKETQSALENLDDPVREFLMGKNCLKGGTGWWKYEFCYGKSVKQYHIEEDGSETVISLGYFDLAKHLEWLEAKPHKRPNPTGERKHLSHLYTGGSTCDITEKPRQTEVKLKCAMNAAKSSVSLYLLEPNHCEYILGVESPLICGIIGLADVNGMVKFEQDEEYVLETKKSNDEHSFKILL